MPTDNVVVNTVHRISYFIINACHCNYYYNNDLVCLLRFHTEIPEPILMNFITKIDGILETVKGYKPQETARVLTLVLVGILCWVVLVGIV